ncbi:hypothetical protein N9H39_07060 [Gammaproteobacteria bacterium]|nr:hypothetical protein [Gammaproteobacteria bacterium]
MKNYLIAFVLSVFLVGCGGGGSTSGGGADANFDVAPYVGNWSGTQNGVITAFGQSTPFNDTANFNIRSDGLISDLDPSDTVCQGLEAEFITSNPYSWDDEYQCFLEGIGLCDVKDSGTFTATGDTIIGSTNHDLICGAGNTPINIKTDYALTKQI